jgi:predicted ester cyclase
MSTEAREMPRIPIADFPELRAEIERLLNDPARIAATEAHRKTFQRLIADGLPAYFKPFTRDAGLARALCADLDRKAA